MDEKKMLDLLRKQAEEIEPPESLSPDAIEQMLAKQKKEIKEAEPKEKKRRGRTWQIRKKIQVNTKRNSHIA